MIFFFFSSSEHDIHILKDILFLLFVFAASNCLNLLFNPKQQIGVFGPFKVFWINDISILMLS